jgi:Ni/Co efflux regulator RcnB
MRHLLISVAALALTAGAAFAQPDHDRGRGPGPGHAQNVGKASMGQGVQQRAQAELRGQAAPQQRMAQGGGPTNFTNQVPGHQPDQGQLQFNRGDRGGDRGGRGPQQLQPQAQPQPAPQAQPMDRRGDRGDHGNWQGRGNDNRNGNRSDNRGGNDNRRDFDNRGGFRGDNRDFGNRGGFNGPRRDWRSYSNYHRDWRPTRRFRAPAYRRPPGFYVHRWGFGEFLPSLFWGRDYWLDYQIYDLPPPPPGAVWVRVGDDALLIDQYSGEIITVSYNVFY